LKSASILCEKCGNAYSKEDSSFVNLFSGFLETLHDYLYKRDHGKDKRKRLRAYFYPNSENELGQSQTSVAEAIQKMPPHGINLQGKC